MGLGVLVAGHPATGSHLAPAATTSPSAHATVRSSTAVQSNPRLLQEQQILAKARADHIPLSAVSLPNLLGSAKVADGVVSPLTTIAPAPMGIGTYGVRNTTGVAQPYTLRSDSWEGTITINSVNSFLLDNDGAFSASGANNTFGVQLNTVTNGTTVKGNSTGDFWTQNVMYWNLIPGTVTFLDNIWNFSSPAVSLQDGTLYSFNGTPVYPEFYFDFGPTIPVTLPVTIHLFLNSSVTDLNGTGYSTVRFGYDVVNAATNVTEAAGVYDTVLFNSTLPFASVPDAPFLVDGANLTPTNFLLYDSEIMIGGPGGGTTTSIYGINATESLAYLNQTTDTYQYPPSAWNVGADTGETSEGIAETYTTPGIVSVGAGPSLPTPFWNATPGGNPGVATIGASLSPTNAFVFVTPGSSFDTNFAAWAPTQTASSVAYALPPGTYTVNALLSDYTPIQRTVTVGAGGSVSLNFAMHRNMMAGVYTPLFAWNNAQLAALSTGGTGSAAQPYTIENNPARGGLNPVFGEMNDFLFLVFPGVLFANTSAHVTLNNPSLNAVTFPALYDGALAFYGLPFTNNLQFEIYDSSNVSIWNAKGITGWFFFEDFGPTGFLPLANVVIWGGSNDLVGHSTFLSQGSSLLLAGLDPNGSSVVWGNTFENSSVLSPTMYPGDGASNGPPIGIFAFESGDLIYNNFVATSITAISFDNNLFTGGFQVNNESWNLPMVLPSSRAMVVNGYSLSGSIVHGPYQGGNFWADYTVGDPLPYDEFGFIETGGDYFPLPITAFSVTFTLSNKAPGVSWSVTVDGVTQTTSSKTLVFYEVPGTYTFSDAIVAGGGSITPSTGTFSVVNHTVTIALSYT